MGVRYIESGGALTHSNWNELFEAVDAKVTALYGGLAVPFWTTPRTWPFFVGWSPVYDRRFYFFTTGATRVLSGAIMSTWENNDGPARAGWFRRYDHSVYEGAVANLEPALDDGDGRPVKDEAAQVCRFRPKAGVPAIAAGLLHESLEAHQKAVDGKDYWVYINGDEDAPEMIQPWIAVEMVVAEDVPVLELPDKWNKYNFFRFDNLQARELRVRFGAKGSRFEFAVGPLKSRCVRRSGVAGTYTLGWNYLHRMLPEDPTTWNGATLKWFEASAASGNNVMERGCVSPLLWNAPGQGGFTHRDPAVLDYGKAWGNPYYE